MAEFTNLIGRCECIFPFEKGIFLSLLEKEIRYNEESFEGAKASPPDTPFRDSLISMLPVLLGNLKTARERLEQTPSCK